MTNQNQNNNSRTFENFGYQPRAGINERGLQPKASAKTLSPPKGGSSIKKK